MKFEKKNYPIIDPTRQFILEGELAIEGKKKFIYLFNDILFLCRIQDKPKKQLIGYRIIQLIDSFIRDLESDDRTLFLFPLCLSSVSLPLPLPLSLSFLCNNVTERYFIFV